MSRPTTAQLAALLTAWRAGSELLDTLGPCTDALLAQLVSAPKPQPVCQIVNTAQMSDSELKAHYAKTAHVEDIRFHFEMAIGTRGHRSFVSSPAVAQQWRDLLSAVTANGNKATTDSKRQYRALVQADRERRLVADYTAKERFRAARIARHLARTRQVQIRKAA